MENKNNSELFDSLQGIVEKLSNIKELEEQLKEMENNLSNKADTIKNFMDKISALETKIDAMGKQIDSFDQEMNPLLNRMDALSQSLSFQLKEAKEVETKLMLERMELLISKTESLNNGKEKRQSLQTTNKNNMKS